MAPRVWFITGSSSGFGLSMVQHVLSKGDIAVATLRTPSKSAEIKELSEKYPDRVLVQAVDTTKKDTIQAAFAAAVEKFGRVDVVYNNAAYAICAEAEATPEDAARAMFDVNYWGLVNVTLEAIKVFREQNPKTGEIGGSLLQVSSQAGVRSWPCLPHYSASKAAVIGFNDSLRAELDPKWKISITTIPYGYFYTGALDNAVKFPATKDYPDPNGASNQIRAFFTTGRSAPGGGNADKAIEMVYKLSETDPSKRPRLLPLGSASVSTTREVGESMVAEVKEWGWMSENLESL